MRNRKGLNRYLSNCLIVVLVLGLTGSCFNSRTYLTPEQISWNPYKDGQVLVFKSSKNEIDSINIKEIEAVFPDGMGVPDHNQRLRVLALHTDPRDANKDWETYILRISTESKKLGEPSQIGFDLRLKNSWFFEEKYDFDWVAAQPEIGVSVPYGELSDVIELNDKGRDDPDTELDIRTIYWSKSKGYVRLDKYDGTFWELIEIIEP